MLLKNNVIRLFLKNPTKEFHLRELAEKAKVSTTAVTRVAEELSNEGIIKIGETRIYKVFSADRKSEKYRQMKIYFTINEIIESKLLDYLEGGLGHPEAVVLFGSSSKGMDTEKSDLDLFVLSEESKALDLKKFEKTLGKPVQLIMMSRKEFETAKKKSPEIINNISNGLVLRGYLKVI